VTEKLERDAVLILPPTLTRLRVHIRSAYAGGTADALHVAVAGNVRFNDVVSQLVAPRMQRRGEVRVFVRMRGVWVEPGAARISEVMEQGRWAEVKIEIGSSGGVEKEGLERGVKAWEREIDRAWEIRG